MTSTKATYWRETPQGGAEDGAGDGPEPVDKDVAEAALAAGVLPVLTEVAGSYHGLITATDLGARLQVDTSLRTRSTLGTWLPRVLAASSALDHEAGRPALTSLVIDKTTGAVGAPYVEVLRLTGADAIDDDFWREKHAADARMACYQWAGAVMPSGGGNAALSPRYDAAVTRDRRRAREEAQPNVCPTCFMTVPPTGVCDNCD